MDQDTLRRRIDDRRDAAARARRLSRQLVIQADKADLLAYAERLEAEADEMEWQARLESCRLASRAAHDAERTDECRLR
jgi:hypothetical protein